MKRTALILLSLPLAGCLHNATKPSEITLVQAMREVGQGLTEMRKAQGDMQTGMVAESAEVTFNIAADSSSSSGLKIDLAAPAVSDGVGVGAEAKSGSTQKRANTVVVKFKNVLLIPKDTAGYEAVKSQLAWDRVRVISNDTQHWIMQSPTTEKTY